MAAIHRFETVLQELVSELSELRAPLAMHTKLSEGLFARRMNAACRPYCENQFITRMAAVAGLVADTILEKMKSVGQLKKAYVNNGGDIALHLEDDQSFTTAIFNQEGVELGRICLNANDDISGIATSGRFGRSFSLGIADSVTVLAETAAKADVAATLIANEVDIPGHPFHICYLMFEIICREFNLVTVTAIKTRDYNLDEQVGYLLRLANQRHASLFQKHTIENLTPTQFSALMRISQHGQVS